MRKDVFRDKTENEFLILIWNAVLNALHRMAANRFWGGLFLNANSDEKQRQAKAKRNEPITADVQTRINWEREMRIPADSKRVERLTRLLMQSGEMKAEIIGRSLWGRPLRLLKTGEGPAWLLVGVHHAMEHLTAMLLLRCLDEARTRRPPAALWVLPMLNPDGTDFQIHGLQAAPELYRSVLPPGAVLQQRVWQSNGRGVDLNHNYDFGWDEYQALCETKKIRAGATLYAGEKPESEPETSALASVIRRSPPAGIITLHTQGEEIYYTGGGVRLSEAVKIAGVMAEITGYRLGEPDGTAAYGGLSDWATAKMGIPSFTVECGKGKNPLPDSAILGIYRRIRDIFWLNPPKSEKH